MEKLKKIEMDCNSGKFENLITNSHSKFLILITFNMV